MIHRHPHVFGDVSVANSAEVLSNWEVIKTEEKQRNTLVEKLRAIPPMLPALMRAQKVSKKTDAGKDASVESLLEAIAGSVTDLKMLSDIDAQKQRMGEVLFDLTTACLKMGIEAEEALTSATERVIEKAK